MTQLKTASLFRNGRNQAVRIPVEFEMPGTEVTIRKEGDKLVLEPKTRKMTISEFLDSIEPVDVDFPDADEGQLPLRDINF
ncbi:MAG TPA: AbrB/MazE/SpoVT family DNA-binding domain-containing protein [Devosia sp.]|nr:AbrB/MazE/SpoVT family DNA-binding domain-containing protein [Devosia sp.]